LVVRNFEKQVAWYTKNFNLVPTNLLHVPDGDKSNKSGRKFVAAFAHVDRGEELVDHHSIFFTSLPPGTEEEPHVHHSSFEIHDIDTQSLGHEWLARQKYESVWGVGRHIIGSQIFDYWWDTTGFMVEHYIDGDVVNEESPVALGPAGEAGLAAWGPEVPAAFLD
jgi:Glyoxalase/Bleomycin resistance protein/Dioxygenase superfamily